MYVASTASVSVLMDRGLLGDKTDVIGRMWYRYPIHVRLKGRRQNGYWYRHVQHPRPSREDRQVKRIHRGPYVEKLHIPYEEYTNDQKSYC
jgi:hypothetical protein